MEEQPKQQNPYLPLYFSLVLLVGFFIGNFFKPVFQSQDKNKVLDVMRYVEDNYVDTIGKERITAATLNGLLQSLDPHSEYFSASDFNSANEVLVGNFEGIGVQFNIMSDTIVVVNPVSGGPSEKVGIRSGDRIVLVDGKKVAGIKITNSDVMKLLKGKKGSRVDIGIVRHGVNSLLKFTVIRDVIPTFSVDYSYMVNHNLGYIKISSFSGTTHEEFVNALHKLKSQGLKKLIIDLRGNAGGYLETAIKIADEILPDGKEIVYTEGAHRKKEVAYARGDGLYEKEDLVILIDEWSASASEILAGAVQDNDRGTIIGRRSFGKGLVQEQVKLKDGSAFRLTIARYYTPTGRCIQKPYKNGTDDYYNEFFLRVLSNGKQGSDTLNQADSLKFKTAGGKTVFGGGGISPDIMVKNEDDGLTPYFNLVSNKGLIYQFAFDYADKNRNSLKQSYRNASAFVNGFVINDGIMKDFIQYAANKGVPENSKEINTSQSLLKNRIKAYMGRNLFDEAGFYPVLLTSDKTFLKAVETLIEK